MKNLELFEYWKPLNNSAYQNHSHLPASQHIQTPPMSVGATWYGYTLNLQVLLIETVIVPDLPWWKTPWAAILYWEGNMLFWTVRWIHCPFSHQHSWSLFPAADYKSNTPANETFIFSKDKKLCFSDCIGNVAHYNDILIILCANQSPCCASGDLLNESYLWWNLWRPENIENCTMHLSVFFLVSRWANSKHLQNSIEEGKYDRSLFPPVLLSMHIYTEKTSSYHLEIEWFTMNSRKPVKQVKWISS